MTILPWPAGRKPRPRKTPRGMVVNRLPPPVLHSLVNGIPGPPGETQAERAARYQAQMAEVMSYNPRDAAEAMIAVHCLVMRIMAEDAYRDAAKPDVRPEHAKLCREQGKEIEFHLADLKDTLASRQSRELPKLDPERAAAFGLDQYLMPDPDDPSAADEAISAVIIALHPAPKMLQ